MAQITPTTEQTAKGTTPITGSIASPQPYHPWGQGWAPYPQYTYTQPIHAQAPVMRPAPHTVHKDVEGSFTRVDHLPDVSKVRHRPARTDERYEEGEIVEQPLDETRLARLRGTIRDYMKGETEDLEIEGFVEEKTYLAYQNREEQLATLQNEINGHKNQINSAINKFLKDIAAECQEAQNQLYTSLDNFYEQYASDYDQFIKDVSFFGEKAIGIVKEERSGLTVTETQHLHNPYTQQYVKSETFTTPRQANNVDIERATRLCHGMRENAKVEQNGTLLQEQFERRAQFFTPDVLQEILNAQFLLVRNGLRTEGKQQSCLGLPTGDQFRRKEKTDLPTVARVIRPPPEEDHTINEVGNIVHTAVQQVHHAQHLIASPRQVPVQHHLTSPAQRVVQTPQHHYHHQQQVLVSPEGHPIPQQHPFIRSPVQQPADPQALPYQTIQPAAYHYVAPHQLESQVGGHRLVSRTEGHTYAGEGQGVIISTPDRAQRRLFYDKEH